MPGESAAPENPGIIPQEDLFSSLCNIIYIFWWTKKQWLRRILFRSAKFFFVIGLLVWISEIILETLHLAGWISTANRIVGILVLALLLFFLFDRIKELREHQNQIVFVVTASLALNALDQLTLDSKDQAAGSAALKQYVEDILQMLLEAFADRGSFNVNVMLPVSSSSSTQLEMRFVKTTASKGDGQKNYDETFRPSLGEGGAGKSFKEQEIIYFPDIRRRHGVAIRFTGKNSKLALSVHTNLYRKALVEKYRSILCVPITAHRRCFGVLNVDTSKKDPFGGNDYRSLAFFAGMMGLALDRYYALYPEENK